jgi:hypothetical protein
MTKDSNTLESENFCVVRQILAKGGAVVIRDEFNKICHSANL